MELQGLAAGTEMETIHPAAQTRSLYRLQPRHAAPRGRAACRGRCQMWLASRSSADTFTGALKETVARRDESGGVLPDPRIISARASVLALRKPLEVLAIHDEALLRQDRRSIEASQRFAEETLSSHPDVAGFCWQSLQDSDFVVYTFIASRARWRSAWTLVSSVALIEHPPAVMYLGDYLARHGQAPAFLLPHLRRAVAATST